MATTQFATLTKEQIQKMLALGDYAPGKTKALLAGIDEDLAAAIAKMASSPTYAKVEALKDGSTFTAKKEKPAAGLYLALVTPGQAREVYNPVFVAADYDDANGTNAFTVKKLVDSYQPESMAKKEEIGLEKSAETEDHKPEGVAAGDVITFTVKSVIPEYSSDYESAVFTLSDVLSKGLALDLSSIKVYKDSAEQGNLLAKGDAYDEGIAYRLTCDTAGDEDCFTVAFWSKYILELSEPTNIVVEYKAKVTTDAPSSVNLEVNTVTLHYSTTPSDETGKGTLKDQTKHYTFDIDAGLLGEDSWKTTEVVKVGLDSSGKEITASTIHEGQSVGALEGAAFKLYIPTQYGSTITLHDMDGEEVRAKQYTNEILTADKVIVSDASGRLTIQGEREAGIRGLDLGTYYLVEESAPAGYIRSQNAVKIEILAPDDADHWEVKNYSETREGYTYQWSVKELKSYEVRINGNKTADYAFTNMANSSTNLALSSDKATKGDRITGSEGYGQMGWPNEKTGAAYGKIINTQGAELPSTGGEGTKIFYGIGVLMMLLGSIFLASHKRA